MLRPKHFWANHPLADWRASQENVCAKLEGNRPIFAIYVYINKYRFEKKKSNHVLKTKNGAHFMVLGLVLNVMVISVAQMSHITK